MFIEQFIVLITRNIMYLLSWCPSLDNSPNKGKESWDWCAVICHIYIPALPKYCDDGNKEFMYVSGVPFLAMSSGLLIKLPKG